MNAVLRHNHWLDALYLACVAGHGCGVRLIEEEEPKQAPRPRSTIKFGGQDESIDLDRFLRQRRW